MKKYLIALLALLALCGCASNKAQMDAANDAAMAPPRAVPAPPGPQTPGSLWTERQGGLFSDNKGGHVGDIVTVAIFERASASQEATTSTGRQSSAGAGIANLFGLEKNIATINGAIDPGALLEAEYTSDFSGSGKTSRKEDLVATLSTQVVEVLPNGNLRIHGNKTVTVNNEDQIVTLTGVVRPADISSGNIVNSKNILDARISYTGKGVISDKQKQGWLVRILDNVWPF